jgi:ferredoxin
LANEPAFNVVLTGADGQEVRFVASRGRSIVKSAALAGYMLTTGCLQGRCAICRARLLEGDVGVLRKHSKNAVGDPASRHDGCVLLCSVGPRSDVVLEPLSPWTAQSTTVKP